MSIDDDDDDDDDDCSIFTDCHLLILIKEKNRTE